MNKAIEDAIKLMAEKCNKDVESHKALQFSQAALNLAHVQHVLKQVKQ